MYHLSCWKEGLTIPAEGSGVGSGGRKGLLEEGDSGLGPEEWQKPTQWASTID